MAARLLLRGSQGVAVGAGLPFGYTLYKQESFGEFMQGMVQSAVAALRIPPSEPVGVSAEITALLASQQAMGATLEHLLRAQNSSRGALLMLVVPAVAAAVCCRWWGSFGWVTLADLTEKLDAVKTTMTSAVAKVRNELFSRFNDVDAKLVETTHGIEQVAGVVEDLKEEFTSSMESLERRIGGMETNVERSTQGVELLCQLVASSSLLADANMDAANKLQTFARVQSETPQRRELPELPAPSQSAPSFLRSLMAPPTVDTH